VKDDVPSSVLENWRA